MRLSKLDKCSFPSKNLLASNQSGISLSANDYFAFGTVQSGRNQHVSELFIGLAILALLNFFYKFNKLTLGTKRGMGNVTRATVNTPLLNGQET